MNWIAYEGNKYCGEVNEKGIPHGHGELSTEELKFEGLFVNGKMEGLMNVRDSSDYKFQVVIRNGEVIRGKVRGDIEELIMEFGTYHGGFDEHLLPLGDGEFIMPDGTVFRGTWVEHGVTGEYTMETIKGSVVRGYMNNGRNNGYTTVEFCNGDNMKGFMVSEENEDEIDNYFDTIDFYNCLFSGNEECPDEAIDFYWDDYMRLRKHPDTIYKDSRLEMMYMQVFKALHETEANYGLLLFDKDGAYMKEYWHQDNEYKLICPCPYDLHSDEEVKYITDRFYEEYHLHITALNDSGNPNEFQWVANYETFEDIVTKGGREEEIL